MKSQGLFKGYFIITADEQVHKSKIPYSGVQKRKQQLHELQVYDNSA